MWKATALLAGTLGLLMAAGPGFAADSTKTPDSTMSAPAEKPSKLSIPHSVTGEVVSTDANANTFTVRDSKGKEYILKADAETAARMSSLKPGDQVKVSYRKSHGEMVATKITESTSARATK